MKKYLLFIIDSLNYSHVKDSNIELMPFINKISKQSIICSNMYSQAPYTEAAVMNIYCGQNVLDNGGYLKRFKNVDKTIFEVMKDNGYRTYYNSFQPQCFPSSLRRGIDDIYYNVGFDLSALWSYRLKHYSEYYKKNLLTNQDYINLREIINDNFEEWMKFLNNIIQNDSSLDLIINNTKTYDAKNILNKVRNEYLLYKENCDEYINKMLEDGKNHKLFQIPAYIQNKKIKDDRDVKNILNLFKPLLKEIRRQDLKHNIHLKRKFVYSNKSLKTFVNNPCIKNLKNYVKCLYNVFDLLFDIDLYERINNIQNFKNAPSAKKHIEHYINWAEKYKNESQFACIHVDDVHNPEIFFTYDETNLDFLKKEKKNAEDILRKLPSDYTGNITHDLSLRYIDNIVKYLFTSMDKKNILKDTCIIITADHGFSFSGNPIRDSYVINLYLENYNIPFIMYNSGNPAIKIDKICTSKDIPATICENADINIPSSFTGKSVLSKNDYKNIYIEYCGGGCPDISRRELKLATFNKKWFIGTLVKANKRIDFNNLTEIYDLEKDPIQLNNLVGKIDENNQINYLIKELNNRLNKIRGCVDNEK